MVEHRPPPGPWPTGEQRLSMLVFVEPVPVDGWRSDEVTMHLRDAFYRIMQESFDRIGLDWQSCLRQPRGNGAVILLPQNAPPSVLAAPLAYALLAALRTYNSCYNESAQLRLRMAAHMGTVRFDHAGPAGHNIETLLALPESAEFQRAYDQADAEFGYVVSELVHDDVVRHSGGSALFRPIKISVRGEHIEAWTWFRTGLNPSAETASDLADLLERPSAAAGQAWTPMPDLADIQHR